MDFPEAQYTSPAQPDNSSNSEVETPPVRKASLPVHYSCHRQYNHTYHEGSPDGTPAAAGIHIPPPRNARSDCNRRDVFPESGFQKTVSLPNRPGAPPECIPCPDGLSLPGSPLHSLACIHRSYGHFRRRENFLPRRS